MDSEGNEEDDYGMDDGNFFSNLAILSCDK